MRFKSEADRMLHPVAKLIPPAWWNDPSLFNKELPPCLSKLMAINPDDIEAFQRVFTKLTRTVKHCAFLTIAVAHRLTGPELREISKHSQIENKDLFKLACQWGDMPFLLTLAGEFKPAILESLITNTDNNYEGFRSAAENGHLHVLKFFAKHVSPEKLQAMIAAGDRAGPYTAFRNAAENGHLHVLQFFAQHVSPEKLQAMIAEGDRAGPYTAFRNAAENGHLHVLQFFAQHVSRRVLQAMIEANGYGAFAEAAKNGHLDVLQYLAKKAPLKFKDIIVKNHHRAFRWAAENGHLHVLKFFEEKAHHQFKDMIANSHIALQDAASYGHLDVLKYLAQHVSPKKLEYLLEQSFLSVAKYGHVAVLEFFAEKAPDRLQAMIEAGDGAGPYAAFRVAALNGHAAVLEFFAEKVSAETLQAMIEVAYSYVTLYAYYAFQSAPRNGCAAVLEFFAKHVSPERLQAMIAECDYAVFRVAALNGHAAVLEFFAEKAPEKLQAMIAASNYGVPYAAFRDAAQNGHIDVLNFLVEKASAETLQAMIAANNSPYLRYDVFRWAAENGHHAVLKLLAQQISLEQLQEMIESGDAGFPYAAFRRAAQNGHLRVLEFFAQHVSPEKLHAMIEAAGGAGEPYAAFRWAAQNGHLGVLNFLVQKASAETLQAMIAAYDYRGPHAAFRNAAQNGHLGVLNFLVEKASAETLQAMIAANNYPDLRCDIFRWAAKNGHRAVLELLAQHVPHQALQTMIAAAGNAAFRNAARNGHTAVLEFFAQHISREQLQAMIEAAGGAEEPCSAFQEAASNGHLAVLEFFAKHVSREKLQTMIEAAGGAGEPYAAFRDAALNGHAAVLEFFAQHVSPEKLQAMIEEGDRAGPYAAFRRAAQNGHLRVLEFFAQHVSPEKLQAMIEEGDRAGPYAAFRDAARNDHAAVLEFFAKHVYPERLQTMIAAGDHAGPYAAFRDAASKGHLDVLNFLVEKASAGTLQAMIAANNYPDLRCDVFRWAAKNGHRAVLELLTQHVSHQELQTMIAAAGNAAFRDAAEKHGTQQVEGTPNSNHFAVCMYLLQFETIFRNAELNQQYREHYIGPFFTTKLAELRASKAELAKTNPGAVFDIIDPQEAQLLFYIAKNSIHTNSHESLENLRFLLSIPAVQALAHTAVTPGEPNELLRLAITVANEAVAILLLCIPAVRNLAEQNNFYRRSRDDAHNQAAQAGLDLRRLASNTESSMRQLSTEEASRLNAAIQHYEPQIQACGGKHQVVELLRQTLAARYIKNPATISDVATNATLTLPLSFEDFQNLKLTPEQRKIALEAYYQHPDHSAWRYLAKPNPWMNPNAKFVKRSGSASANGMQIWSLFEESLYPIAICYLAASDSTIDPIDEYTLETRFGHFIHELALIGRAHNWDTKNLKLQHYDDRQGDNPSCSSGTVARLFQSVQGHPLFQILTPELIDAEIRGFVYTHFKEIIGAMTPNARGKLKQDFDEYIISGNQELIPCLKDHNIPEDKQKAFYVELTKKYGERLTKEQAFKQQINAVFPLEDAQNPTNSNKIHLIEFWRQSNLELLFQEPKANQSTQDARSARFFTDPPPQPHHPPGSTQSSNDDDDHNFEPA